MPGKPGCSNGQGLCGWRLKILSIHPSGEWRISTPPLKIPQLNNQRNVFHKIYILFASYKSILISLSSEPSWAMRGRIFHGALKSVASQQCLLGWASVITTYGIIITSLSLALPSLMPLPPLRFYSLSFMYYFTWVLWKFRLCFVCQSCSFTCMPDP